MQKEATIQAIRRCITKLSSSSLVPGVRDQGRTSNSNSANLNAQPVLANKAATPVAPGLSPTLNNPSAPPSMKLGRFIIKKKQPPTALQLGPFVIKKAAPLTDLATGDSGSAGSNVMAPTGNLGTSNMGGGDVDKPNFSYLDGSGNLGGGMTPGKNHNPKGFAGNKKPVFPAIHPPRSPFLGTKKAASLRDLRKAYLEKQAIVGTLISDTGGHNTAGAAPSEPTWKRRMREEIERRKAEEAKTEEFAIAT